MKGKQPWLGNPAQEGVFILGPALVSVLIIFLFQDYFTAHPVNTWWWLTLVLCIDVGHVYSTLFRLYWDRKTLLKYKSLLIAIPVIGFLTGFALHYFSSLIFWRVLAYIAVWHFVRQQYGFMRLYSRQEPRSTMNKVIDGFAIYSATLYPLLYWHFHATDKLAWFVKGDFVQLDATAYEPFLTGLYFIILATYLVKEAITSMQIGFVNIPKNLMVIGTYASWYVGIVAFQGDLIFTLLNVVAHGIPYMALIWIHGEKKNKSTFGFNARGVAIFIASLFALAYTEEFLWDVMVWNDHPELFPLFSNSLSLDHPLLLSLVVSILVLPQITHYVLDGFIWRFSKDNESRLE